MSGFVRFSRLRARVIDSHFDEWIREQIHYIVVRFWNIYGQIPHADHNACMFLCSVITFKRG
jgi:hypothetical protein